jgi:glycosyltransferase involved in cell wall biosynthesis
VTSPADSGGPVGPGAGPGGAVRPGSTVPRVALVLGTAAGGVIRHARMLAAGMADAGVLVIVCAPPAALQLLTAGSPLPAAVSLASVDIGDRPRLSDASTARRLRRLLTTGADGGGLPAGDGPADVIHAHGLRAGALSVLAAVLAPSPRARLVRRSLVVTIHNAPPAGRGLNALVYRVLEVIVARGAGLVLCVSPDLERRMRRAGARRVARAVVPAPAPSPPPSPAEAPAAAARPATPARPVVLAVGRLAPQKGLSTLLEAAAHWRDMDPVPRVVIAGEGPLLGRLRDQAASLGVDAEFLGHRDDVPALLAACDVFALPSTWEGQPLAVQEALLAGAAIVATKVGGVPDLVGPQAAYLVRPGDAAELAAGVRAVLTSRSLAARLRAAAARRARSLPTEQDAITAALAAYATVRPALLHTEVCS